MGTVWGGKRWEGICPGWKKDRREYVLIKILISIVVKYTSLRP